ncbi:unnamed protein product [Moneuplotes crassus]|uniref:Uncharacterized protein n=1 Tax=Euplotes crassus TaxID=5936 RepID=A0AAD1UAV8_EUPCR|nr:unnamed protein product [Moneuplotes crassus]
MLRYLEKGLYVIGTPALLIGCTYWVYKRQKEIAEDPFEHLEDVDSKYLSSTEIKKLENDTQKVYILGIDEKESIENIRLVNNFIRDLSPRNVVVELCDERFNERYNDIMKHPKFEAIMQKFYNVLNNDEKVKKLGEKSDMIELQEMEYLVAIDLCSYHVPQCRSLLGDRNRSITEKRIRAKLRLSDILTQEEGIGALHVLSPSNEKDSAEEVDDIKKALAQTEEDEEEFDFDAAKEEDIKNDFKTDEQIYQEVIIDEINQVMLKNIAKADGNIIAVIMKNERIPSFMKLWKGAYDEFYQDVDRKKKLEEIKEKRLKKKQKQEKST